jgi:4-hydroxy-4-methyl-2-oxoglutarate aldolase
VIRSEVVKQYQDLRVSDVRDGLDWVGMPTKGTVSRDIHRIAGKRLCGPAFTVRSRPSREVVPPGVVGDEYTRWAREYWYGQVLHSPWDGELEAGDVVVLESPDLGVGEVGSYNSLDWHTKGAQGIVSSGGVRDYDELQLQQVPIFARHHNQTMTQGRVEYDTYDVPVTVGGVQVRPGDIVVADGDGVIVVPLEHAEQVARYARQELENDKAGRRRMYEQLGWQLDDSVR